MPTYQITDPATGRTLEFEGPVPPSEAIIRQAFAQLGGAAPAPQASAEPEGSAVGRFLGGAAEMLNPITMAEGVGNAILHPIDTGAAILGSHAEQVRKAADTFQQGRYSEALGHAGAALLPIVGPIAADVGEQIGAGDVAGGLGKAAGLLGGPAALKGAGRVAGAVGRGARGAVAGTMTPVAEQAAAVKWALENQIPVDPATATGSRALRWMKTRAESSIGGDVVGENAAKARATALEQTGRGLAEKVSPEMATPETAGAGVRSGVEGVIRNEAATADEAYAKVRAAERAAQPDDVPVSRPVAGSVSVDQGFIGHWLADDLSEQGYQKGGSSAASRKLAEELRGVDDEAAHRLKFNPGAGGTPVLGMFHDAGVSGSYAEVADKVRRTLRGESQNPRIKGVIDAMREAWDGQRFDFDLVTDETLARTGLKRRQLVSPRGLPNVDTPGASSFFGEEAAGLRQSGTEPMQLAVDVRGAKAALRPVLERLEAKRSAAGILMDPKEAGGLAALRAIVGGADHLPLSVADDALGEIKALARGASMPELRSGGQGVAAQAVKALEDAVQARAKEAGVWDDLSAGRQATIRKWGAAETLKMLREEPVGTFRMLTGAGDAGIDKLREVQRIAPGSMPAIGRGYLEKLFDQATDKGGFGREAKLFAEWNKLGPETRKILYPDPAVRSALDKFFLVAERMAENVNPSGSGKLVVPVLQGTTAAGGPLSFLGSVVTGATLSKLLNSPKVARLLTEGMQTPKTAPAARALAARLKAAIRGAYSPAGVATAQASQSTAQPAHTP